MQTARDTTVRVLHVGSGPAGADLVAALDSREGFTVESVGSVETGRARLDERPLDCLVAAHEPPDTDGLAFLCAVREEWPDLPFILYTTNGEDVAEDAIAAGVTDYVQTECDTARYDLLAGRIDTAVRARKEQLLRVTEFASATGGWELDLGTDQILLTDGLCRMLGLADGETLSLADGLEMYHPDDRADVQAALDEAVETATQTGGTWRLRTRDGDQRRVELTITPVESNGEVTALRGALNDVTERTEIKRRRAERLDALRQVYTIFGDRERSFEDKLTAVLDAGREYLGVSSAILTRIESGTQHIEVSVGSHPELQPGSSCPLEEAYCKRTVELDEPFTVVDALAEGWEDDPAYERFGLATYIGATVRLGEEIRGTLCFMDTDLRERREFGDAERTFVEWLARWVGYELERERDQKRVARERDRLEEFARVVSHDLRNPLNVATGRLELAQTECDSDNLDTATEAVDRSLALVDDLLTLARGGDSVGDLEPVSLSDVTEQCWQTVPTDAATLRVETDRTILADESRLQQLLSNLVGNAVEHGTTDSDEAGVTVTIGPTAGGFYVADDGIGLAEDTEDEIFDAGFSTTDGGTGFGLRIVKQVVDAHDWEIRVSESDSGGARFDITGVTILE
jgi:PAS domain S-box-containing protein